MGHCINYSSYPESINKKSVQTEWDKRAYHDDWEEGGTGLPSYIEWRDITFNSEEEAEKYIKDNDHAYSQLAVKYREHSKVSSSKALNDARKKRNQQNAELNALNDAIHYQGVVSAYISCRHCGSMIASKYFGTNVFNKCPVCREDLRPKSTLDRIARMTARLKELEEKYQEELKKSKQVKTQVFWLVKTEYHV